MIKVCKVGTQNSTTILYIQKQSQHSPPLVPFILGIWAKAGDFTKLKREGAQNKKAQARPGCLACLAKQ